MSPFWISIAVAVVAGLVGLAFVWKIGRAKWQQAVLDRNRKEFRLRREMLEARFFQIAAESGKPRDLRWSEIEFENEVAFARDRRTGLLSAFVGVFIQFEAVEGGPMEDVEAVGNMKVATAVFHFRGGQWDTDGQVLFNLNPSEAIERYQDHFEKIIQEPAAKP